MGRRGRKSKSETVQKDVITFTADKEKLLEVFDKKAVVELSKEVIDKFDIKPVARTPMLGERPLDLFVGKDYESAIRSAYEWRDRKNKEWKDRKIELVSYYPQKAFGNSVLVSYNIVTFE